MRTRAASLCLVSLFALLLPLPVAGTPAAGEALPPVAFEDLEGRKRTLPDPRAPVVVIYEDSKSGDQNLRAADLIDRTTDLPANRGKIEAVAIADLAKWNWWPAKKFALAEVKKVAAREQTPIYADWSGAVRKAWRLTRGKSGILVIGTDGRVRFAGEGPLSEQQLAQLTAALGGLGVTVATPGAGGAGPVRHRAPEEEKKVPDPKE